MPRVVEAHPDPLAQVHHLAIFAGVHLLEDSLGIVQRVERLHRGQAGPLALLVFPLGIPLLDVGGVPQHDGQKLPRQAGAVDVAGEALLHQQGNAAGVVDVGVGHQHIVDVAGGKVQGVVVVLVLALLQTAVDEELPSVDLQTVTAAGDGVGCAEECDFHSGPSRTWIEVCGASGDSSWSYCTPMPGEIPQEIVKCAKRGRYSNSKCRRAESTPSSSTVPVV